MTNEQQRVAVIERVFRKELTMVEAPMCSGSPSARALGSRIKVRIRKERVGVIHGNRGRRSPQRLLSNTCQRIVELARGKYRGFNDHHLTEKLADVEGMRGSRPRESGGGPCPVGPQPVLHVPARWVVAKGNIVAFQGAVLLLPKRSPFISWIRQALEILVLLDGSVEIVAHADRFARFDATTARAIGVYRTNGRPLPTGLSPQPPSLHSLRWYPDIFMLPLLRHIGIATTE